MVFACWQVQILNSMAYHCYFKSFKLVLHHSWQIEKLSRWSLWGMLTMWAAMTRPVDRRALPPAFIVAAATALHEQKLKTACKHGETLLFAPIAGANVCEHMRT